MKTIMVMMALAVTLSACGATHPSSQGSPDAVGTVVSVSTGDDVRLEFAPDPGFEYFEGTVFVIDASRNSAVVDGRGQVVAASSVSAGQRIEVWVDSCMESFPVQCPDPYLRILTD